MNLLNPVAKGLASYPKTHKNRDGSGVAPVFPPDSVSLTAAPRGTDDVWCYTALYGGHYRRLLCCKYEGTPALSNGAA